MLLHSWFLATTDQTISGVFPNRDCNYWGVVVYYETGLSSYAMWNICLDLLEQFIPDYIISKILDQTKTNMKVFWVRKDVFIVKS